MSDDTRIITYGARDPLPECRALADRLLLAGHRYGNHLVEIERRRRARYREMERTVISAPTLARLDEATRAEVDAYVAIARAKQAGDPPAPFAVALKAARAELRAARVAHKAEAEPLRDASRLVKGARDAEKIARKAAHKRDRDGAAIALALAHDELASRLFASDEEAEAEKRAARAASGVHWGIYSLVEEAASRAAADTAGDPHAPRYHRTSDPAAPTGDEAREEGRIGTQPMAGGITVAEALAGAASTFRLELVPLPEGASRRMAERRHAIASIRVGTDDAGEAVWLRWPVLVHRPLPEGAIVRRAWARRVRLGPRLRWEIQITIAGGERPARLASPTPRAVAVDLGWRSSAGYRVGYLVDTDGTREALRLPRVSFRHARHRRDQWARAGVERAPIDPRIVAEDWSLPLPEALDYLDGLRSVRDKNFDVAIGFLRAWLDEVGDVPAWMGDAVNGRARAERGETGAEPAGAVSATIARWKQHERLQRLQAIWQRAGGDAELGAGLAAWAAKERHLYDWEAHGRRRALGVRRDYYRQIAARLARTYDAILLPDSDLTAFAELPDPTEGNPSEGRALRRAQRWHAPGELREAIASAGRREGRDVRALPTVDDSRACHACGSVESIGADLMHACLGCGAVWDRDANACVNRLRKGGFDEARALRCCEVQRDRSQGAPPTGEGAASSVRGRARRRA